MHTVVQLWEERQYFPCTHVQTPPRQCAPLAHSTPDMHLPPSGTFVQQRPRAHNSYGSPQAWLHEPQCFGLLFMFGQKCGVPQYASSPPGIGFASLQVVQRFSQQCCSVGHSSSLLQLRDAGEGLADPASVLAFAFAPASVLVGAAGVSRFARDSFSEPPCAPGSDSEDSAPASESAPAPVTN